VNFTGRIILPSFVTGCLLAALVFVVGSSRLSMYRDLDAGAATFLVSFGLAMFGFWIAGYGEDDS
jgi:hypothetical protein